MSETRVRRGATPPPWAFRAATAAAVAALLALIGIPVLSLLLRLRPAALPSLLTDPIVIEALRLSFLTSLSATLAVVSLGLPVAHLLATRDFTGKRLVEVLIDLPMVLPPTVAGLALLMAFGRTGLAGHALGVFGFHLPFTTLAVVLAQTFMAAPFFIGPARAGFASVDARYLEVASTLRASPWRIFTRVMLPLSFPSVLAGAAMCCARALGEFGATITFAGNMPGVTQTMPLAVYIALQTDLDAAVVLSVLLLIMSSALLLALRLAPSALPWNRPHAGRRSRQATG